MKSILLFIFILLAEIAWSQNVVFEWNKILGDTALNSGTCIKTDSEGYIYTSGCFSGSVNFLGSSLLSKGDYDSYLAKMDSKGELKWLKQFSGNYNERITSLEIDRNNNIYVCGSYRVKISFDTTLITNNADTIYSSNMFVAKYSPNGNMLWAKNTGGIEFDGSQTGPLVLGGNKLTVDNEDNLIITGKSIDINLFDTIGQIHTLDSAQSCQVYPGTSYCHWEYYHPSFNYLAKYTSDGKKIWIKQLGGCAYTLKTDNSENIIVSGNFECLSPPCSIIFDSATLTPIGGETIFLVKYNKSGKLLWTQTAGGYANYNTGYDLTIDSINAIYLTGQVSCGNVQFGKNIQFDVSCSNIDAFIAKADSLGEFKWAKIIGNPQLSDDGDYSSGNSIIIMNNNILMTGSYKGSFDINGTLVSGLNDMILVQTDLDGNVLKAGTYGSSSGMGTSGKQITFDTQKNIYITGYTYQGGTSSSDPSYIYIAKISAEIPTSLTQAQTISGINIYPNPCEDNIYLTSGLNRIKDIRIYSINGSLVLSQNLLENNNDINVSSLQKGIYALIINTGAKLIVRKLIKE
jgi:hypothetical protein